MDYDAIVIGGGPAGLTAAAELAQAHFGVLLLEKESFGGWPVNLDAIVNYPVTGERVAGPTLSAELIDRARQSGVRMEQGEVTELESYSRTKSVTCADGKAYTCSVVVVAGGLYSKPLGIPGEDGLQGRGMIHCAACDAALYTGKRVAVCGGGRSGIVEAMTLAKHAAKVLLIEAKSELSAHPGLQERARANPKLEIRFGERPVRVLGEQFVTGLEVVDGSGRSEVMDVDGVLVHVGFAPMSRYLDGVVPLDDGNYVIVDGQSATEEPGIFAAGDIRRGSPRSVISAVNDARLAAQSARQHLES